MTRRLNMIWQDLRFTGRRLQRHRLYTLVAVSSLALGMGAVVVAFNLVYTVLLRPLPYPDSERLVTISVHYGGGNSLVVPISEFREWADRATSFEGMALVEWFWNPQLTGFSEPRSVSGLRVSGKFFSLVGVQPYRGRPIVTGDDREAHSRVAMVSYRLWQRELGGDPGRLGSTIHLDNQPYTVIGILPPGFAYFFRVPDVVIPVSLDQENQQERLWPIARLKRESSLQAAADELTAIHQSVAASRLEEPIRASLSTFSERDQASRTHRAGALPVLLVAALLLMLICCLNVSNLMVVHTLGRRGELAVRASVGARRFDLLQPIFLEALVLSAAGLGAALLLLVWTQDFLLALLGSRYEFAEPALSTPLLAPAIAVCLGCTAACTLIAGRFCWRFDFYRHLRDHRLGGHSHAGRSMLTRSLITFEVAATLILLTGSGILINTLWNLSRIDAGIDTRNLLVAGIPLSEARYSMQARREDGSFHTVVLPERGMFLEQLLARTGFLPGVESAATVVDFMGSGIVGVSPEGRMPPRGGWAGLLRPVSPGFFRTLGIPMVRGRAFSDEDRQGSLPVIIISDWTASRFWPDEDPIGKRFRILEEEFDREVIGVAANVKQLHDLEQGTGSYVYIPDSQLALDGPLGFLLLRSSLAVRTSGEGPAVASEIRRIIRDLDPLQAVASLRPMEEILSEQFSERRQYMWGISGMALVGLLLSVVGIYGVVAYSVVERTFEIGVRMALGADSAAVTGLVLRQTAVSIGAGVLLGIAGAPLLVNFLKGMIYGIRPYEPLLFVTAAVFLVVVALAASYVPARRAARVDPLVVLRLS